MKDKFFVGQREATIDVKRRMSISSPFMDVLRSINQNHLYLNKYSETLSDTTYPILGLKTSLYCPEEMFFRGEEKIKDYLMRDYSSSKLEIDKQNRILIPEGFLGHLRKGSQGPMKVIQTGLVNMICVWNPEDFKDWESRTPAIKQIRP